MGMVEDVMMECGSGEAVRSVLAISGSDSSGGAGMQADIKTIAAHGLFAQSAITALTAQNTTGVYGVCPIDPSFVAKQIDVVFDDIRPDAVKIGMVSSPEMVEAIACALERNGARNIVVDPVMVATSGSVLAASSAIAASVECLFPLATIVTPNIPEAEALSGMAIETRDDMREAAYAIAKTSGAEGGRLSVLIKGGHGAYGLGGSEDLLLDEEGGATWIFAPRIDNPNSHGTGCTLSSAIACGLAEGMTLEDSCIRAKDYISGALSFGLDMGRGSGPLNHMWKHM